MVNDTYEINFDNIPPDLMPDKNIILWRYMSFSSLCEILMHDDIPLISVSKFSDKSEGIILRNILSKLPNTHPDSVEFAMQKYFESIYISSWHKSQDENAAMWDRYTQGDEGVVIKTNAELLMTCINTIKGNDISLSQSFSDAKLDTLAENSTYLPHLIIKHIKYVSNKPTDFEMKEKYLQNGYDKLCFFYKLEDFKNESEVRILQSTFANPYSFAQLNPSSIYNIDNVLKTQALPQDSIRLNFSSATKLIQEIVISPYAHSQFIKTVKDTIKCINFCRDSLSCPVINPDIVIESRRKDWV